MTIQDAIDQLVNLKHHCQSMVNDDCPEWADDAGALDAAIEMLESAVGRGAES